MTLDLAGKLAQLAPFGAGHAEPRFVVEAPRVFQPRPVGRGHVACLLAPPAGPAALSSAATPETVLLLWN